MPDYHAFFDRYAAATTRLLDGEPEADAIIACFAEISLALGEDGTLKPARREEIGPILAQLQDFYRSIGTQRIGVERVEVSPLAPRHDRVVVFYAADYRRKDGSEVTIPFSVTYLLQVRADGPKIFAFIAGDEMALYREHGLVDQMPGAKSEA